MQNTHTNEDILKGLDNLIETNIEKPLEENIVTDSQEIFHTINEENVVENIDDNSFNIESEKLEIFSEIEISVPEMIIKNKPSKIISWVVFLFKYITTSGLIFALLLVTTNYSAYTNIAKSYIYHEELENTSAGLINSVNASQIQKIIKTEVIEKEAAIKNEEEEAQGNKNSIKNLITLSNKNDINLDIEITPYENRIVIPKIWKNIPLLDITNRQISWEKELNDIFMKELENWVIRYPGSAKPGTDWNSFIFGHSSNFPWIKGDYNDVFSLLDKLKYEDDIIIYYGQKKYTYKIREKKVITPWDISILKRNNNKSEITLMTCWPIWTTLNRLIVTWELVEE
jgi:LPXTG-site transpeptidase (sortase) family protein